MSSVQCCMQTQEYLFPDGLLTAKDIVTIDKTLQSFFIFCMCCGKTFYEIGQD
jgi:hypothetical protein